MQVADKESPKPRAIKHEVIRIKLKGAVKITGISEKLKAIYRIRN